MPVNKLNKKVAWIDVETTGLMPWKHDIIQLAIILEEDGEVFDQRVFLAQPVLHDNIDPTALQTHGMSKEEIMAFPDAGIVAEELLDYLNKFIDPFDRLDKMYFAGHNAKFDNDFLRSFWKRNMPARQQKYFGSYFYPGTLCTLQLSSWLKYTRDLPFDNAKLATLCGYFGVELLDAHDAMNDIRATRELARELLSAMTVPSTV